MSRFPGLCAVILAAGASSRMGRDKALLPWPPVPSDADSPNGETFLSVAIRALSPFAEMVIVVAGNNEHALAPAIYASGASLVRNPKPERGQFSSMQVGLTEVLARGYDAAMITLVDSPPPSPVTLEELCRSFELALARGRWGVAPEVDGKHGHPLLANRKLIEAFVTASPESNAREVKHANGQHIEYISVGDPFVAMNVNTPEEYARLKYFHQHSS
jgi:molybdenum cofactor cytidylyltransferase